MPATPRRRLILAALPVAGACALLVAPGVGCAVPITSSTSSLLLEGDPDLPTALWATWDSPEAGNSWVEYAVEGEAWQEVYATDEGTHHAVLLLGLPPDAQVEAVAHTEAIGVDHQYESSATTGEFPADFPFFKMLVAASPEISAAPFVAFSVRDDLSSWLTIIDREGRPVWAVGGDLVKKYGEIELDPEGGDLVVLQQNREGDATTLLRIVPGLPESLETYPAPEAHHGLAALPGGNIGYIATDARAYDFGDGSPQAVMGDAIMERADDGTLRTVFSTWDWAEPVINGDWQGIYPDGIDWTHANALDYDPHSDSYLMSLRNPVCILRIDRATGAVLDKYGGNGSDWDFSPDSRHFFYQHDVRWTPDGHLLMISTQPDSEGNLGFDSRAIEYALDEVRHELVEVWEAAGDSIQAHSHGGALRLENGNTLVNWGEPTGMVRELTPGAGIAWEVQAHSYTGAGASVLGVLPLEDLYL